MSDIKRGKKYLWFKKGDSVETLDVEKDIALVVITIPRIDTYKKYRKGDRIWVFTKDLYE